MYTVETLLQEADSQEERLLQQEDLLEASQTSLDYSGISESENLSFSSGNSSFSSGSKVEVVATLVDWMEDWGDKLGEEHYAAEHIQVMGSLTLIFHNFYLLPGLLPFFVSQ